jgi:Phage integrase, N-terminal SAM-like domain
MTHVTRSLPAPTSKARTALRQRMIEDMRMRKLAPNTQAAYIRAVKRFARFLGASPDTATIEDMRRFQLHLIDEGASPITLNASIIGLRFFFDVTLNRGEKEIHVRDDMAHIHRCMSEGAPTSHVLPCQPGGGQPIAAGPRWHGLCVGLHGSPLRSNA